MDPQMVWDAMDACEQEEEGKSSAKKATESDHESASDSDSAYVKPTFGFGSSRFFARKR